MNTTETTAVTNKNEFWTSRDTLAVILVGIFWIVAIFVILTSKHIPKKKRWQILRYGTLLMIVINMVFSLFIK